MRSNLAAAVVDGSRRDRSAYAGELDIYGTTALTSIHDVESMLGPLDLLGSY